MKKILTYLAIPALMLGSACNSFLGDINNSPNSPTEVNNALLLSSAQLATFSVYTGQLARLTSVLTQHSAGTDFQFVDIANYTILEGDNVNEWENIYSKCVVNENLIITQAGDENPYYRGIAKVMKAMALGVATDLWGDVPNREAAQGLEGADFYNPGYDVQEMVLQDIQTMLDEAIADLSKDAASNQFLPATDDFIHGGNPDAWIKTARILKARFFLRQSERDGEAATKALAQLENAGLSGVEDDANAIFGQNGNEWNLWYSFQNERGGYMQMGEHFIELLKSIDDPRLAAYATQTSGGEYVGTPLGSVDNSTSAVGTYFSSPAAPSPMVTYVEAKFIEAEAQFLENNLEAAATAHNEAIKEHIAQVTGEDAPQAYVDAQASETAATITREKIMTHKYVAMFTQIESYNDWRRTGIPALTANPQGVVSGIPVRLPTPSVERINNTNAKVVSDIMEPVWWDQ
ncbi:MAG: SusD/RagB family nutrient-binding outer membrane lipoprotein [Bacteroidota bacterium]